MRYMRIALITGALIACIWVFHRVLQSSWCEESTLVPMSVCGMHPKRWIRKGNSAFYRQEHGEEPSSFQVSTVEASIGEPPLQASFQVSPRETFDIIVVPGSRRDGPVGNYNAPTAAPPFT